MQFEKLIDELRDAHEYATSTLKNPYRYSAYYNAAADAIEELQAKLWIAEARLEETTPRWISVKERLPEKQGGEYLVAISYPNGETDRAVLWYDLGIEPYFWNRFFVPRGTITHWMPLPSTEGLNET